MGERYEPTDIDDMLKYTVSLTPKKNVSRWPTVILLGSMGAIIIGGFYIAYSRADRHATLRKLYDALDANQDRLLTPEESRDLQLEAPVEITRSDLERLVADKSTEELKRIIRQVQQK